MPTNDVTPAEEVKTTAPNEEESTDAETPEEEQVPEEDTPTLESLQTNKPKTPDSIPYDRFKEVNDQSKAKDDVIAELTAKLESQKGEVTQSDATRGLNEIAKEYGLDPQVLGKVADEIKAAALAEVKQELAPITEAQRASEANKVFETMYAQTLKSNPQYADVANKDIVKQLAFNPANANKTFPQLLAEVYPGVSKSVDSKKTMETTKKGKTEAIDSIDYARAQTDSDYFKQIMSDPALKKQYNDHNTETVAQYL